MNYQFVCPHCGGTELHCVTKGLVEESVVIFSDDGAPLPGDVLETFYDHAVERYTCTKCQMWYTAEEVKDIVKHNKEAKDEHP